MEARFVWVLEPGSVAIADAGPTGVGARKARRLEEEINDFCHRVFYARQTSTLQLAGLDNPAPRRPRCAMVRIRFSLGGPR